MKKTIRGNLLRSAIKLTEGDRNTSYGDPADNLGQTADLFNTYFSRRDSEILSAQDVAAFNILQKLSRLSFSPGHVDSWTDIAAYAAIGGELAQRKKP